jgi:hypothetical protein
LYNQTWARARAHRPEFLTTTAHCRGLCLYSQTWVGTTRCY